MDREQRKQLHLKRDIAPLSKKRPTIGNMQNGEEQVVYVNGVLRKYRKEQGQLYYMEFTKE